MEAQGHRLIVALCSLCKAHFENCVGLGVLLCGGVPAYLAQDSKKDRVGREKLKLCKLVHNFYSVLRSSGVPQRGAFQTHGWL